MLMKKIALIALEIFLYIGVFAQTAVEQSNVPLKNQSNSSTFETIAILLGSFALTGFIFYLGYLFIGKNRKLNKSHK
jgi:hypothetical protein